MIGPIQRDPRNLLRFLDIVGGARRPADLEENVRATVDLTQFYGSSLYRGNQATANVQNPGDAVQLAVPPQESWLVLSVQYGVLATAIGDAVACSCRFLTSPAQAQRVDSFDRKTALTATTQLLEGTSFAYPILLTPGSEVQMVVDDSNLGAARVGVIGALFYRITT